MKMTTVLSSLILSILLGMAACTPTTKNSQTDESKTIVISMDSGQEFDGEKIAISTLNPELPTDWSDFNFVSLELKASTSQRFFIGFTTETGYNELRIMNYAPNGWIKLAIPLRFYTKPPAEKSDVAGTLNQPLNTGWVQLIGERMPLVGVDSIGFRMQQPLGNPTIEIRSIELAKEDPGSSYLGETPIVDEFGQSNLVDFEGKIKSLEQLQSEWQAEEAILNETPEEDYSKYGGYLGNQYEATGFFRLQEIEGRWWFIDPEGYPFLSYGVDCISPGSGGNVKWLDKRPNFCKELPPEDIIPRNPERPHTASFGKWNLYRRFGEEYPIKSRKFIIKRMGNWGVNTIANWSDRQLIGMNQKAFMLQLYGLGVGNGVMGLADVYANDFAERIDEACKEAVSDYKDNPWLIGYFVANEPAWINHEDRLCEFILDRPDGTPLKTALLQHVAANDSPENRKAFVYKTFGIFLEAVTKAIKKYDPNHLNLGMRFSHIPDDSLLEICGNSFDVFSFNCYELFPKAEVMDRILETTGLPMVIGEYHFGTSDRGMAQSLVQVDNQQQRGVAFRYYTERAFAHPGLIGTAYFQWADQDLTGRGYDGENYNCGIVDVTDRPYPHMVEAIKATASRLQAIHAGELDPTAQQADRACDYGWYPNRWK